MVQESYIEQLIKYIRKNLSKGYTIESLRWALQNQGYSRSEINRAIKLAQERMAEEIPRLEEKPVIKVEREPILKEIEPEPSHRISNFWKNVKEFFMS